MTIGSVALIPYLLLIAGGVWLGQAIHLPALYVVLAIAACVGWAYARHRAREAGHAELQETHQHCGAGQVDSPDC